MSLLRSVTVMICPWYPPAITHPAAPHPRTPSEGSRCGRSALIWRRMKHITIYVVTMNGFLRIYWFHCWWWWLLMSLFTQDTVSHSMVTYLIEVIYIYLHRILEGVIYSCCIKSLSFVISAYDGVHPSVHPCYVLFFVCYSVISIFDGTRRQHHSV